jgi:type I restriction enzyme S subunit
MTAREKQTQSILAKAFRGELAPQDPNDEPASVLLGRIKAEKAASAPKGKPRRTRKKKAQKESLKHD